MKNHFRHITLINKLSLLLVFAMLFILGGIGFYFDYFLKENHLESTKKRMLHGYERLAYNLDSIEGKLEEGSAFIKTDESMLASIDLINNYQDKQVYNAILLDEEKKLVVQALLARVKLSFNDAISLYDHHEELIACVTKEPEGYLLQFVSYRKGEPLLFSRFEHEGAYRVIPYLPHAYVPFTHTDYYQKGQPKKRPVVTYAVIEEKIVIKSHFSITEEESQRVNAHVELFKILDNAYFEELSQDLDMSLTFTSDPAYGAHALPFFGLLETDDMIVDQTEEEYRVSMAIETLDGPLYFVSRLNKAVLRKVLDENRYQFLGILITVAVFILALTRYLFHRGLALPFGTLMRQIEKIEHKDYGVSEQVKTGDELETISRNVNRLAHTVRERESSLRHSKSELLVIKENLQESLNEFKHLFNTTLESIVISKGNRCIDINDEGMKLFGFYSREEVAGMDILDLIAPDGSRDIVLNNMRNDVTSAYEANALTKGGRVFPALLKGYNYISKDGVKRISAVIDLTEIKKSQAAVEQLNQNLQSEVDRKIDEIRQKDDILIQQSKHAAMGEMISNISHQWRQPLSALGLLVQDIDDAYEYGELDKAYINRTTQEAMGLINYMSQTIDDFRNFFAPTDKKVTFRVHDQIGAVTGLVSSRLTSHNILLEVGESDVEISSFPNKFKQVIINILNNANDAITARMERKEITNGTIRIEILEEKDKAVIRIDDNGGGIDPEIIPKIFDPYFTTKFKAQGTGIGLYMSKAIVEKNMQGELTAENIEGGARFMIRLPKL